MPADYSGKNLRGHSFKGQDLSGANFSGADIRGVNFTGANLQKVNFSHAKAGLQKRWAIFLIAVSFLLSGLSAFCSLIVSISIAYTFHFCKLENQITGWVSFILVIIFCVIVIRQGIARGMRIFAVGFFALAVALALALALALARVGTFAFAVDGAYAIAGIGDRPGAGALVGAVIVTAALVVCGFGAVAFAFTGAIAFVRAIAFAIAFAGVATAALAGAVAVVLVKASFGASPLAFSGVVALALFSTYIGLRAITGDEKHTIIRNTAVTFAAFGGTSFRNADLTDADFTGAILKNTDFRKATLIRTSFHETKKLDLARCGFSYLQNTQVRQLLVMGQTQDKDKNLDRENLCGVNFKGVNLVDASFIGANLSEANLQDADLSRAILKQTQLDGTDFTGATLTGAYIEDWGITSHTKFDKVRCEHVHMRVPTKENPDPRRKPDNREEVFADGEFRDFIKPIVDTLDLYHNQGVDPRAIAISFKQLAEKNPEAELEIVAMERRGEDKFLLRAKTAPEFDKSQLSAEYFEIYNHVKALAQQEVQALIAEKDNRIVSLENMVNTALQRPNFYSSTQIQEVSSMTSNPGGFSVDGSVGGDINNVQGDNNRAVQGDNNQAIQGDGNQVNTESEASLTKDDIVALLTQLENLVQAAEVSEETKETAIEDISAAKKATQKEEPKKNVALANLESVTQTLEKTSKTVDAGQKLWSKAKPIITKIAGWLGAAAGSYLLKL